MRTSLNVPLCRIACLIEVIYESPLFVGQHSKRVLRHSLWNDTLFLAKMNVMDYSLVIGIDEEHRDLVLGIIGTSNYSESANRRLHSHVYMGQKARELGKGKRIRGWRDERTYNRYPQTIQKSVLFPFLI